MFKNLCLIISVFIMSFLVGYYGLSWTGPTGNAPSNNAPAPINVSATAQTKEGNLSAAMFYDSNDPSYYVNPSGNSNLAGSLTIGGPIKLPSLTTAQRDALTPQGGMMIYNTDKNNFEIYFPNAWRKLAGGATLGVACVSSDACESNYCFDAVCCNSSCTGNTCQRCDSYSNSGAGTCSYVSTATDPDNECNQGSTSSDGCRSDNCSGTGYSCGYQTSGKGGCPNCYTCSGATSQACAYQPSGTLDACTGAYTCSGFTTKLRNTCNGSGACSNNSTGVTPCSGTCASYCSSGSCISTDTSVGTCTVSTNARVDSGGNGHCASGSCITDFTCGTSTVTFTYKGSSVTYGTVSHNSKCWLDRNLGASQVATAYNDSNAYGDLFQWGRLDDQHQTRTSGTTSTLSSTDVPGHSNFILVSASPYDWRSGQNNNLWQGVSGTNNPCPSGWRLPTSTELDTERASWSSQDYNGAYASPLKLPAGGYRDNGTGSLTNVGSYGRYWSSTFNGTDAYRLSFYSVSASMTTSYRANGFSVRCLKD